LEGFHEGKGWGWLPDAGCRRLGVGFWIFVCHVRSVAVVVGHPLSKEEKSGNGITRAKTANRGGRAPAGVGDGAPGQDCDVPALVTRAGPKPAEPEPKKVGRAVPARRQTAG